MNQAYKCCISMHCVLKHKCELWRREASHMYQNFIYPESTGDACHFYQQKQQPRYGEGAEPND